MMLNVRSVSRFLSALTLITAAGPVIAADADPPAGAIPLALAPEQSGPRPIIGEGYQLDPLDEPLKPLEPVKPRTGDDQSRVDATAWYLTGQLRESRNDFKGAYEAYKKAIAIDPESVHIYRALIPLAFSLNQSAEGVEYAKKAVELDPENYQLLRRLAVHMAGERKVPEAIQLLEQAVKSPRLDQKSGEYVTLHRDLGLLYAALGKAEESAKAYEIVFTALTTPDKYDIDFRTRAVLLADPATTYERMGQVFLDSDRTQLALKAFERAASARKGKPGSLSVNLAKVYLKTKQHDKALEKLQGYFDAQLQSKGREAYVLLAEILGAAGRSDELIPRLEKIAKEDSRNSLLQYYLAEQYFAKDRLKDARTIYEKVIEATGDIEGYAGLAAVYRRQSSPGKLLETLGNAVGDGDGAARIEEELTAIGEDPQLLQQMVALGRKQIEGDEPELSFGSALVLGKLTAAADKSDDAITFYRFALKANPQQASTVYEELGEHLLTADQFDEAAKVYQEAVDNPALAGSKPNFLFRLSQAHEFGGNTQAALKAVAEAQKTIPDHPLLQYQEAWIYYHSKQYDKAIERFEKVINDHGENTEIVRRCQFSLSNIYVQQGEQRKGEEVLEKVLAEDPDNPSVNNDLGYLYADQGKNLEQAEKMIRKALAAEPENAAYLDSMGWVLYKLGKYEEAVGHLEKAVSKPTGGDATIFDHLGDCYERLGKTDKATAAWKSALKDAQKSSSPDTKLIERIRQKLKKSSAGAGSSGDDSP